MTLRRRIRAELGRRRTERLDPRLYPAPPATPVEVDGRPSRPSHPCPASATPIPARQELAAKVAKHTGDGHEWRVDNGSLRCSCTSVLLTKADRP